MRNGLTRLFREDPTRSHHRRERLGCTAHRAARLHPGEGTTAGPAPSTSALLPSGHPRLACLHPGCRGLRGAATKRGASRTAMPWKEDRPDSPPSDQRPTWIPGLSGERGTAPQAGPIADRGSSAGSSGGPDLPDGKGRSPGGGRSSGARDAGGRTKRPQGESQALRRQRPTAFPAPSGRTGTAAPPTGQGICLNASH